MVDILNSADICGHCGDPACWLGNECQGRVRARYEFERVEARVPRAMTMYVISTGFNPPEDGSRLRSQVMAQRLSDGRAVRHTWIDAALQLPPKSCPENLLTMAAHFAPEDVIVWVDLDDELCDARALARVAEEHAKGAWVTHGSFRYGDGRPGFAAPYKPGESFRTSPWRLTHLKSFRAGLLHRIKLEHLQRDGVWIDRAVDMALMMPMAEMAGHDRCVFMPENMVTYNLAASFEWNASPAERAREKEFDAWVRALPPYERIEAL
jgi:hypothetical protein